jgi:hypothetical protein
MGRARTNQHRNFRNCGCNGTHFRASSEVIRVLTALEESLEELHRETLAGAAQKIPCDLSLRQRSSGNKFPNSQLSARLRSAD